MLMLVSVTSTLMQGHSRLAEGGGGFWEEEKILCLNTTLTLKTCIWLDHLVRVSGSAEGGYVSVERLLNPTGNQEKQKEIQEMGLIIHRKHLTLGNVIGQGAGFFS